MKLLVIVLNFRTAALAIDCVRSLQAEIDEVPSSRVVICENGSGDDSSRLLRDAIVENGWNTWVDLKVNDVNLGFTGGNNVVLQSALASADPPDFLLLLNSDTVVKPGALAGLVSFMDTHPRAGIATAKLLSAEGEEQASAFRFHSPLSELNRGLKLGFVARWLSRWAVVLPPAPTPFKADWVPGAAMILRRELLQDIGLLDEGFFTYFEDVDLCFRAKHAGWEVWYVPESEVIHLEGASSGIGTRIMKRRPAYWFQARRRFFLKHYGCAGAALADLGYIAGFALWRLRRWIQRKPDSDPPFLLLDALRHSVFVSGCKLTSVKPD